MTVSTEVIKKCHSCNKGNLTNLKTRLPLKSNLLVMSCKVKVKNVFIN